MDFGNAFNSIFGPYKENSLQSSSIAGLLRPTVVGLGNKIASGVGSFLDNKRTSDYQKELESLLKQQQSLYARQAEPMPLTPDFASINAKARKQAGAAFNPHYQTEIQNFIARRTTEKNRYKRDSQENIKTAEQNLADLMELGKVQRERSLEDEAIQTGELNTQEDLFQTQSGEQFDVGRGQLQTGLAEAGLTTSGLGRQQVAGAEKSRNVEEADVARQVNLKKDAVRQLRERNFADIFDKETRGQRDTDRAIKGIKIDLEDMVEDFKLDIRDAKRSNERRRLSALQSEEMRQQQLLLTQFVRAIQNPETRLATMRAYGIG